MSFKNTSYVEFILLVLPPTGDLADPPTALTPPTPDPLCVPQSNQNQDNWNSPTSLEVRNALDVRKDGGDRRLYTKTLVRSGESESDLTQTGDPWRAKLENTCTKR